MISVLYVDDEPVLLEICKIYLERGGDFSVDTCMSGSEALEQLEHFQYDVIIADYQMPVMNGIALLKKLKESGDTTPFIIFTGRGREEVVIEAFNNGADFYLQKGGDPTSQFTELSNKVRHAVSRRRAETALKQDESRLQTLVTFYQMTTVPLKELMIFAIEKAVEITASSIGYLAFVSDDETLLTMYAWSSGAMKECAITRKPIRYPLDSTGLWGEAVRQRRPVITNDYAAENPLKKGHPPGHVPIIRHMNIPVFDGSRIVMVAGVGNRATDYTERNVQELSILMSGLWTVIKQRRAEEELSRKNEELNASYEQLAAQEEELRAQYDSLAKSEAEWESTFNTISDWISLVSPGGKILRTNRAVETLLGIQPGDAGGRNCFELIHGAECPEGTCPRRRMLESRKREVTEIQKPDGTGWLQITVDPVLGREGEVISAVHIVRDISERIRSEKALEQAKKKLNLLNYLTINDIRNRVFTVAGYQHLVKEKVTDPAIHSLIDKQQEILQKISHSLNFAQSYQDLGLRPPRWQNAGHVFLMAISHLDFLKINHTIKLDGLEVFSDPLLEQVFQILGDNTLVHGKTATKVTLWYDAGPDALTLFFEDNGVGIPEGTKDRIFSPDFQKKKGVGLFLAQEILGITGITILETGTPGKGARFEITVPKGCYRIT